VIFADVYQLSCRWMFLEEVEIVLGVFDSLLLVRIDWILAMQGVVQSVTDGYLGCFDFLLELYRV